MTLPLKVGRQLVSAPGRGWKTSLHYRAAFESVLHSILGGAAVACSRR
jgi:hypothetical protein